MEFHNKHSFLFPSWDFLFYSQRTFVWQNFGSLFNSTLSSKNKDITPSIHKGQYSNSVWNKRTIIQNKQRLWGDLSQTGVSAEAMKDGIIPLPLFPPTFYLRQLIIRCWSVFILSWSRTVTSKPAVTIKQRNEQIAKLLSWYPYLCVDSIRCTRRWPGRGSFAPLWQVHHHPPVTLARRDDAGFVLRQAHLGMFGSVLIDMIILNVSA